MCQNQEHNLNLLLNYPLISSNNKNGRPYYSGVIRVKQTDYSVEIIDKSKSEKPKFSLRTDFPPTIKSSAKQIIANDIFEYLNKLVEILSQTTEDKQYHPHLTRKYRKIIFEYSEFTKFHLNIKSCNLERDLSKIIISSVDGNQREHFFQVKIDFDSPNDIFVPCNLDLPPEVTIKRSSSLTGIYDQFLAIIESLQDFWDILDNIDQNCTVIDPITPTKRCNYRRIWISDNLSILVTIEPTKPKSRPDLKFLGPDRIADKYRERLNEKLENWEETSDILSGILEILELKEFPVRMDVEENEGVLRNTGECSICFSLQLNGKVPEVICENRSCENFYHVECLYEWLIAVNAKRIFNQIHGLCPNCEKGISCPIIDAQ